MDAGHVADADGDLELEVVPHEDQCRHHTDGHHEEKFFPLFGYLLCHTVFPGVKSARLLSLLLAGIS